MIVSSFVLVWGNITIKGIVKPAKRRQKGAAAKKTMDRIVSRGLCRDKRIHLAEAAAIPKAIFGTELDPLTKEERQDLRKTASWVAWGDKHWLRGAAATMNLIEKGHRLYARQAQPYHQQTLWRRMLKKSKSIREAFKRVWKARRTNKWTSGKGTGPVAILERTINDLGWLWDKDPLSFQRSGKVDLPFIEQEDSWWTHEVRGELRDMI